MAEAERSFTSAADDSSLSGILYINIMAQVCITFRATHIVKQPALPPSAIYTVKFDSETLIPF
jgi:hypothetical protein